MKREQGETHRVREAGDAEIEALFRAALGGDEAAYAAFLRMAAVRVRAIVRRKAGGLGVDGEDIVQECLLAIHLKRHTWRPQDPLAPWLAAITRYKVVDAFRRRGRRIEVDVDDVADVVAAPEPETASARDVARALESLAPGQRQVVSALAVEGRSIRETATALGMTENAVRVALHRGLAAIAARFGRERP